MLWRRFQPCRPADLSRRNRSQAGFFLFPSLSSFPARLPEPQDLKLSEWIPVAAVLCRNVRLEIMASSLSLLLRLPGDGHSTPFEGDFV